MYKLKTYTLALLAAFMACIMSACKDEPTVHFDVGSEDGNLLIQFPYGYSEATITFACSEDYLDLFETSIAIHSSSTLDLIQPTRDDFKLSEENVTVSFIEGDETVERVMPVYTYSFNVTLEGNEGFLMAFAIDNLIENWEDNLSNNISIYRGYKDISIKIYCPDGQFATSQAKELSNVSGYKSDGNELIAMITPYLLASKIPTLALLYKPSEDGNNFPAYTLGADDLTRDEVLDYFNSFLPTTESGHTAPNMLNIQTELKRTGEVVESRENRYMDFNTVFERMRTVRIVTERMSISDRNL